MNHEDFERMLEYRIVKIAKVLKNKSIEYAPGSDRFHNFRVAARMDDETPERSLKGMWKKHLVAVFDIIDELDYGKYPTEETIDEKIGDSINYLILLEGLLRDRICKLRAV